MTQGELREMADIKVLYVETGLFPEGVPTAFESLERKLPSLKKRRCFGVVHFGARYWAAVEAFPADDAEALGLKEGVIPGGKYASAKLETWDSTNLQSRIPAAYRDLSRMVHQDHSRPVIEYYKSKEELFLLMPVTKSDV